MAKEAIERICEYLEKSEMGNAQLCAGEEKESAALARELCYRLLDAASANGAGGCPLCTN